MPSKKKRFSFTFEGKRYQIYASNAKEAGIRIAEKQRQLEEHQKEISGSQTLKAWSAECIAAYKTNLRPKVRKDFEEIVRHCILHQIGDLRLKEIRPIDCQRCLNLMSGYSSSYINAVYQAMRFLFRYAVINSRIQTDPTEGLQRPSGTRRKRRALSSDERAKVLRTAPQRRSWWVYLLMMLCGCRPGEAAECKGSDLSTVTTLSGEESHVLHIRGTKTKAADRRVPVPEELYELIKAVPKDEYISVTSTGGKHGQNWTRHFRNFCRHAGIDAGDLSAYNLRHEYGTECARRGLDIRVTMKLMGHSSIRMTAEIYTNLEDEDMSEAMEALRHVLPTVLPEPESIENT